MTEMNPLRRLLPVPDSPDDRQADPEAKATAALVGAGRGDEVAFSEFYDLTVSLIYGIVRRVVRDPAMSDETVQEIYLEVWRLAPRFNPDRGSAKTWTATIAHRRAVDRVRSEQARRARDERDSQQQPIAYDQAAEEVIDRFERSQVARAMETLSQTQREAITLAYYGGKTYREVAALLDVPDGTAKTRIRDGLIKLRDHFGVAP